MERELSVIGGGLSVPEGRRGSSLLGQEHLGGDWCRLRGSLPCEMADRLEGPWEERKAAEFCGSLHMALKAL